MQAKAEPFLSVLSYRTVGWDMIAPNNKGERHSVHARMRCAVQDCSKAGALASPDAGSSAAAPRCRTLCLALLAYYGSSRTPQPPGSRPTGGKSHSHSTWRGGTRVGLLTKSPAMPPTPLSRVHLETAILTGPLGPAPGDTEEDPFPGRQNPLPRGLRMPMGGLSAHPALDP